MGCASSAIRKGLCAGPVAIKSLSSETMLDGRAPEHHDPLLTKRDPVDVYLTWTLEELEGGKFYAIKSKSSEKYLDGRAAANLGTEPHLTAGDAKTVESLQWEMIDVAHGTFAFKNRASGGYLDGKTPENAGGPIGLVDIAARDIKTDKALHWQVIPQKPEEKKAEEKK
jgi:hypothetical protein